jgi:hypothetical protein
MFPLHQAVTLDGLNWVIQDPLQDALLALEANDAILAAVTAENAYRCAIFMRLGDYDIAVCELVWGWALKTVEPTSTDARTLLRNAKGTLYRIWTTDAKENAAVCALVLGYPEEAERYAGQALELLQKAITKRSEMGDVERYNTLVQFREALENSLHATARRYYVEGVALT